MLFALKKLGGVLGGPLRIANDLALMAHCGRGNRANYRQRERSLRYALEAPNSELLNKQVSMLKVEV
jgi:hypothetical protein